MAVRSGAGTGVVVSLVVFILTTIFLLILTIVFYSGQTKAIDLQASAESTLATYVKPAERNNETFKFAEDSARSQNQSVAMYMQKQMQDVMQYVGGNPTMSIDELQVALERYGVTGDEVLRDHVQDTSRSLEDREDEIDRMNTQLGSWEGENAELKAQLEDLRDSHQEEVDTIKSQIQGYRDSAEEFRRELDDTIAALDQRVERLISDQQSREGALQNEIDQLGEERVVLLQRVDELESKVRQGQITPQDPSLLVDGRIIDSAGSNEQVFIDRGRNKHIVLGMTFEVYDDQAALSQVDRLTGRLPRGKASLQVIKVGETTSTCKIVRSIPGRPVVRNDVIANAVYDPTYKFKFLVHGKFDVDGDGRPTEAEAEYLRSLILDWGGEVVTGEELPGDLDFLLLGAEPPFPTPLRASAPKHEMDTWVRKRQAHDNYNRLKKQAMDAQIPVLNANRFFILTGYTIR